MPRKEIHSDDTAIEQMPDIVHDPDDYDGDIVLAAGKILAQRGGKVRGDSSVIDPDYLAELAFMEEPVTIRLEPSSDRNAISVFAVWVNGKGAEVFLNNRWVSIGWLPVGQEIIIKRKYLEVIVRTKIDTVHTEVRNPESDRPHNAEQRFTSAVHSFSVLEDQNPRGRAWLSEMRRRNF